MNDIYEWVIHWVTFHLEYREHITEDVIMSITEDTLKDYDMKNPNVLSDNQWDDLFVAVCDYMGEKYQVE